MGFHDGCAGDRDFFLILPPPELIPVTEGMINGTESMSPVTWLDHFIAGTDVAIEAADIVLMHSRLGDVYRAIHLSQTVFNRIRLNFMWALGYTIPFLQYLSIIYIKINMYIYIYLYTFYIIYIFV